MCKHNTVEIFHEWPYWRLGCGRVGYTIFIERWFLATEFHKSTYAWTLSSGFVPSMWTILLETDLSIVAKKVRVRERKINKERWRSALNKLEVIRLLINNLVNNYRLSWTFCEPRTLLCLQISLSAFLPAVSLLLIINNLPVFERLRGLSALE